MGLPQLPVGRNADASPEPLGGPPPECLEVLANFWDYVDGNCCPELVARIDAHVSSCAPCLRFRQLQECFFMALAGVREGWPAPDRVRDRVRRTLAAERRDNWQA